MTAAIWSTPPDKCALYFPAQTLFQFMHNHHLLQLTVKMCYTPTGIINVKDEQVQALANEIQSWLFTLLTVSCVNHSPEHAPICYVTIQFFFVHPFMRQSQTADSLSSASTVADWQTLVARARYGYHTYYWSHRLEQLTTILKGKAIMDGIYHLHGHARSKIAEVISLLSNAATNLRKNTVMKRTSINPTQGVQLRKRGPNQHWRANSNSFPGDPDAENGEKPVPSHLVVSPTADTPSSPIYSGDPLPDPIPVNVNPLMHGLAAAANLYERESTFLDGQ
ncbi:hypothetical protein F5146DRAFT_1129525 [Armillaria mellea]|nr:hypothetical protein F5146DRAFT_1129525 [Armillaria mellea]